MRMASYLFVQGSGRLLPIFNNVFGSNSTMIYEFSFYGGNRVSCLYSVSLLLCSPCIVITECKQNQPLSQWKDYVLPVSDSVNCNGFYGLILECGCRSMDRGAAPKVLVDYKDLQLRQDYSATRFERSTAIRVVLATNWSWTERRLLVPEEWSMIPSSSMSFLLSDLNRVFRLFFSETGY